MEQHATVFTGKQGEAVPLQDMRIEATLRGVMAEVVVTQDWRNDGRKAIEGVYTFPLPLDAVLLDFDVVLAGQALKGRVVRSAQAEREYEDALEAGDSAIRLEQAEPGLYTVHVGNLAAGETARFSFRYVLLHRWSGDQLRLSLPTTVAPRYNDSLTGPGALQHSLVVENQFGLQVRIEGDLAGASIDCPTHRLQSRHDGAALLLEMQQPRMAMDRDLVLNLRASQASRSVLLTGRDGSGVGAVASFMPVIPGLRQQQPLDIALVIDCSYSMSGTSIDQARIALDNMLASLQPTDRATLLRFGSRVEAAYPRTQPCTPEVLQRLRDINARLAANLGGTETALALQAAADSGARDIFLVTDGEVGHWQDIVDDMRKRGVRVFCVGVGMAIAESFLRQLSEATGGACEAVNPNEDMAGRLLRHFQRLRAPAATDVTLHWPAQPTHSAPSACRALFEGDTLVASALFDTAPDGGDVVLEFRTADGAVHRQSLPWVAPTDDAGDQPSGTARLAADHVLREPAQDREPPAAEHWTVFAERYQLMSPLTNMIVVAVRAAGDKQHGIPELRVVPQTLAAGWGGLGIAAGLPSSHGNLMMSVSEPRIRHSREYAPSQPTELPLHLLDLPEQRARFAPKLLRLLQQELHRWSPATAPECLERMLGKRRFRSLMSGVSSSGFEPWIAAELLLEAIIQHLQPDLAQLDAVSQQRLQELCARNAEHRKALKPLMAMEDLLREDEEEDAMLMNVLSQRGVLQLSRLLGLPRRFIDDEGDIAAPALAHWLEALEAA